jgi:hypothetical protein
MLLFLLFCAQNIFARKAIGPSSKMMLKKVFILALVVVPCSGAINRLTSALYTTEPYPSFDIFMASNTTGNVSNNTNYANPPEIFNNATYEQPDAMFSTVSGCSIDSFIIGFGFDTNGVENGFNLIPPDPSGAAGRERLVAVVNAMIEVRTKAGNLTYRDSLKDFFSILGTSQAGNSYFDPKVVYDEHAQRFVVVGLERNAGASISRILLAVSKNELPVAANDWYMAAINSALTISGVNSWADYPGFEVDEEAVYITANMFSFSSSTFQGSYLWIVNKGVSGGFYGGGSVTFATYNPYQNFLGISTTTMPAQIHGSGGAGISIGTFLVSTLVYGDGSIDVQIITVQNPLGAATFTLNTVELGQITQVSGIPDCPQLGSTMLIEANDYRILDAVWQNDKLWLTHTMVPLASDVNANQATAHWVRINTSTYTLEAQGNLGGETFSAQTSTTFPAVAVNSQGQVAFGYAASSPTIYAGAYGSIFLGNVEHPFTVKSGLDFYVRTFSGTRNRWGDYTGISVDPTDGSFWIFNQFADVRAGALDGFGGSGRWGTVWARVICVRISNSFEYAF